MTARGSSAKIFDFQTGELTDVNPVPNVECRATDFKIQDCNINNGDWVLVQFIGKKSQKHFVGQVLSSSTDDTFSVKFLRYNSRCEKFAGLH